MNQYYYYHKFDIINQLDMEKGINVVIIILV